MKTLYLGLALVLSTASLSMAGNDSDVENGARSTASENGSFSRGIKRSAVQMNEGANKENEKIDGPSKRFKPQPPVSSASAAFNNLKAKFLAYTPSIPQGRREDMIALPQNAKQEDLEEKESLYEGIEMPQMIAANTNVEKLRSDFFVFSRAISSQHRKDSITQESQKVRIEKKREREYLRTQGISLDKLSREQQSRFFGITSLDLRGRKDILYYQKAVYYLMRGARIQAVVFLLEPTSKTARKDLDLAINFLVENRILTREERDGCL